MPEFQAPTAPPSIDSPHDDLRALCDLASELAGHDDVALAPYAEDIAEAYEALCAVDEHLPALTTTKETT